MGPKRVGRLSIGLLVLVGWAGIAAAGQAFVFNSDNIDDVRMPGEGSFVALRFKLSGDIVVTDLGMYDYEPAGLYNTWNVSIWRCGAYNSATREFADMTLMTSAIVGPVDGAVPAENGCHFASVPEPALLQATQPDGTTIWYIVGAWSSAGGWDAVNLVRYDDTPAIVVPQAPVGYGRSSSGQVPMEGGLWFEDLTPLAPLSGSFPGDNFGVNFKYTVPGPVANAGPDVAMWTSAQSVTTILGVASHTYAGTPIQYRWLENDVVLLDWTDVGVLGTANLSLAAPVAPFSIGEHALTLEVRVTDSPSVTASDSMLLTVSNSPPAAQPAPTSQAVEIFVDAIIIAAELSDFDGDELSYEWRKDGEVLASGVATPPAGGAEIAIPDLAIAARDPRFSLGLNEVELVVDDGFNEPVIVTATVDVQDTRAPTLCPIPSRIILWPADGQLKPVTIWANAFDRGGGPTTLGVTVESSRPPLPGETDYYIDSIDNECDIIRLRLRAERRLPGLGRIYKITVTATDQGGNSSSAILLILAPRHGPWFPCH